ncbi:MAG: hypothetical protein VXW65_06875 [Pseudomonadota bacterium]|nr:hypothetical protein [Pseudomonadota bacterium]
MATQYVIRTKGFVYNDEWFIALPKRDSAAAKEFDEDEFEFYSYQAELIGGAIHQVFNDEEKALACFKEMVIKQLRQRDYCMQFDPYRLLPALERFIQDATCNPSFKLAGEIPPELDDDVLFRFAQEQNWLPYELSVFEHSRPFYAVWCLNDSKYLRDAWSNTTLLVYEDGYPVGDMNIVAALGYEYESDYEEQTLGGNIIGSPEQLSDQPILLKQLLELPETGINYYGDQTPIEFLSYMPAIDHHFHTFNSLLKQPIYELHPIRPEQIKQVFDHPTVRIV